MPQTNIVVHFYDRVIQYFRLIRFWLHSTLTITGRTEDGKWRREREVEKGAIPERDRQRERKRRKEMIKHLKFFHAHFVSCFNLNLNEQNASSEQLAKKERKKREPYLPSISFLSILSVFLFRFYYKLRSQKALFNSFPSISHGKRCVYIYPSGSQLASGRQFVRHKVDSNTISSSIDIFSIWCQCFYALHLLFAPFFGGKRRMNECLRANGVCLFRDLRLFSCSF